VLVAIGAAALKYWDYLNNPWTRNGQVRAMAQLDETRDNLAALEKQVDAARAAVEEAQLNLEFTEVKASVDRYVTNLQLRLDSQAVANQPAPALVDSDSYWVDAYFRETETGRFKNDDRAVVPLMSYPDLPIEGRVDSISRGIAKQDGSTGFNLLPSVSPTFEWIRLAQRVPVRIHFDAIPDGMNLRVGTTASLLVMTGTAGSDDATPATAALSVLQ